MTLYSFETLENEMKQVYREYLLRVSDVVNFAGICRLAGVNYDNFRKFICGNDRYLSIEKLRIICETIKNIEKIA